MMNSSNKHNKSRVLANNEVILYHAINWLLNSGIQNKDGGYYSWYDKVDQHYTFLYPEITGYAIQCLINIYDYLKNPIIMKKIIKAGNWLLEIIDKDGAIYSKYYHEGTNNSWKNNFEKIQYTFDASICSASLLDLYKITLNEKYLTASKKILNWYLKYLNKDGSINAGYHIENGFINENHWSKTNGIHHLKDTITLLKHYEITYTLFEDSSSEISSNSYHDLKTLSNNILKWGIKIQNEDGRFNISDNINATYTHAHCYAIEGLLYSGNFLQNKYFIIKAILGAKWLSKINKFDIGFWDYYSHIGKNRKKVNDSTSQALRIWILLSKYGNNDFLFDIQKTLKYLGRMQCLQKDRKTHGGIFYSPERNHINSWTTMFLIQSLLFLQSKECFSNLCKKLF